MSTQLATGIDDVDASRQRAWREIAGLALLATLMLGTAVVPALRTCVPIAYAVFALVPRRVGSIKAVVAGAVIAAVAEGMAGTASATTGLDPRPSWPVLVQILLIAIVCHAAGRQAMLRREQNGTGTASIGAPCQERNDLQLQLADQARLKLTLFDDAPIPMMLENWSGIKKLLEEVLATGVRDLDAYLAAHPEFILQAQGHHRFIDANRATVALFGAADKTQFFRAMATSQPKAPTSDSVILRAMARGDRFAHGERAIQTIDGRRLSILWQVDLSSPTADHLLFTAIDITHRKATEEALLSAQAELTHTTRAALLGEMAASIAHEVNQPLAAIGIYAESSLRWLERPEPNIDRARRSLAKIAKGAQHAGEVVQKIKGFVRRETPEYRDLDLREVLSDTEFLVVREARNHRVALKFDAADDLPLVVAVKVQVQQVLINLIINAIHALADQRSGIRLVSVLVGSSSDDEVVFEVKDTGPGIAQEHLEKIFNPFFSTRAEGLGLGLALCRSIVEAHGGRIHARNHGGGASFVFTLRTIHAQR